jgi:hypothetical protein
VSPAGESYRGPQPRPFDLAVAAAVEGDRDSLQRVLEDERIGEWAGKHRMASALYLAAKQHEIDRPEVDEFHKVFVATAAQWIRLRAVLTEAGTALDDSGVSWIPLKGLDTAERFFPRPELRLSSDVDLLVPAEKVEASIGAMEALGWDFGSSLERAAYQREEGYAWQGRGPHGDSVELHYRLWGMVPESLVETCWRSATESPDLGRNACRLEPSVAFVISAVHSWIQAGRPQFIYWWEMKLIADRLNDAIGVVATAREHELQFPVGLAAEYVGRLWDHALCLELAGTLLDDLRWPERMALARVRRRGIDSMTLELMYVARLLARRPSRMGWKSAFRRFWPHPATVERTTPSGIPWWRRRVMATARNLGLAKGIRN